MTSRVLKDILMTVFGLLLAVGAIGGVIWFLRAPSTPAPIVQKAPEPVVVVEEKEPEPEPVPDYMDFESVSGVETNFSTTSTSGNLVQVKEDKNAIRTIVKYYPKDDVGNTQDIIVYRRLPMMDNHLYISTMIRNTTGTSECPVDSLTADAEDESIFRLSSDNTELHCMFLGGFFKTYADSDRIIYVKLIDEPFWSTEDINLWLASIDTTE